MDEELIFRVLSHLNGLGYKVRTEQMLGLPCGATTEPTEINLDADLKTLELNARLREQTGLPTLAWASIFAPYPGTKLGDYCRKHGFYSGDNTDIPETFFEQSVLRFPRQWVGPRLSAEREEFWLSPEGQEQYREKLTSLRQVFQIAATLQNGHILARNFLDQPHHSLADFSTAMRRHVYDYQLYDLGVPIQNPPPLLSFSDQRKGKLRPKK